MSTVFHNVFLSSVDDRDPRVRRHALDALRRYQAAGGDIGKQVYERCNLLLQLDEEESVRLAALTNISAFAFTSSVPLTPYVREEVFIAICDAANDAMPSVREQICRLLGYFHDVDTALLLQTLYKTMRSGLSRKRVPASACGAFVHGLEDEFEEVRRAAIDSICKLSLACKPFASEAIKSLLDMVNDENDAVRLRAIRALKAIGHYTHNVRIATHAMLKYARFENISQEIHEFINDLLAKLEHWPADQLAACRMFGEIGKSHAFELVGTRNELLGHQEGVAPAEKPLLGTADIFLLCILFNAATKAPQLLNGLSNAMFRHYMLIRDTHPKCMPSILSFPETAELPRSLLMERRLSLCQGDELDEDPTRFEHHIADKMRSILIVYYCKMIQLKLDIQKHYLGSPFNINEKSEMVLQNDRYHINYNGLAYMLYNLLRLLIEFYQSRNVPPNYHHDPFNQPMAALLLYCYRIEYLFSGYDIEFKQFLMTIRQIARQWTLLAIHKNDQSQLLLEQLEKYSQWLNSESIDLLKSSIENCDYNTIETILDKCTYQSIQPFTLSGLLHQVSATILQPTRNYEKPISFIDKFPLSITVKAQIYGLVDSDHVAVVVQWPDQTVQFYWPAQEHFSTQGRDHYLLETTLPLSTRSWSESHYIEIAIVRCLTSCTELDFDTALIASQPKENLAQGEILIESGHAKSRQWMICISSSVHFYIWPQQKIKA
ncbi:armadillo-type protein [Syncephalis fuscata]|nr:armadillo-type protein [Syncephalis fuscata]